MQILLVEDDAQLAEVVARVLREEGHVVELATGVGEAELRSEGRTFDLVVLDRMLPDGDGLELCARWREQRPSTGVLMLTARGEVADRVQGLRGGADDYLVKPFELNELLARIESIGRRRAPWVCELGPLVIDRRAQIVRADGRRIDLTNREYAILARLADCPGECVTRQALLEDVWNMRFDPGSGIIDVRLSRLREKLGEHAWMIETVRGKGIRLRSAR